MFIEIWDYSRSVYADGQGYHEPGRRHALTPPSKVAINTQNIVSIEKNPDKLKSSFVGGPSAGECDYVIRMTDHKSFYIMEAEAQRLFRLLNVTFLE